MASIANPSSSSIVGSSDFELLNSILRKLDHLNIEKQIEDLALVNTSGASCDVYKGYWQVGVRRVQLAVKKLRIHCKSEPVVTRRLLREAYIWSKLKHRNVLPLMGFYLDKWQYPHLVSLWMTKGTLFDYLKGLELGEETIRIAKSITAGLSYLHGKGVIHADVKSPNILMSDLGCPLIMDFGVSRIMAASVSGMCKTSTRSNKGTVRWTAVELFGYSEESESNIATEKSDVWALGMVIYELLTRKLPYHALVSDVQVIGAIMSGKLPNPPSPPVSAIEQNLWAVCKNCWLREPGLRPSASTIHSQLGDPFVK
ncbi:kinase-like protein [Schizopora paradoxa]|uniref:Kinase-like protein n=1 Tax=Schizopora paradoxa TaxID=27342 RepID=A0A0H2S673_9AGAM|nr:kinase-like protein [Schizopora paradoxa]